MRHHLRAEAVSDLVSRIYRPAADKCCEACCFGNGTHAAFCTHAPLVIFVSTRRKLYDILFGPAVDVTPADRIVEEKLAAEYWETISRVTILGS